MVRVKHTNYMFIRRQVNRGVREQRTPSQICRMINQVNGEEDQITRSVGKNFFVYKQVKLMQIKLLI